MAKTGSITVQMNELLEDLNRDLAQATENAARTTAIDAAKRLRTESASRFGPGRYARGWWYKALDGGYIVYNRTDWQLTHLLENGHDVVNQFGEFGHWNGNSHIAGVEQWGIYEFPTRISRGLK